MNAALDTVKPVAVDFGALLAEQASAVRLMMTVAQIIKHVDGSVPIRFLIAETETGYTLLAAMDSTMVLNPLVKKELPYDPARDFEPISLGAKNISVLEVRGDSPAHTVQDLLDALKARPGKLNFGNPGIGSGNFFLQPGHSTPREIIADIKSGLYVTEFLGFGVNLVTGDFSRGASGLWIENGELTFPVEEITVAGNLKDMFRNVSVIGNDLEFRSSIAAPTLRVDGMTIAGE